VPDGPRGSRALRVGRRSVVGRAYFVTKRGAEGVRLTSPGGIAECVVEALVRAHREGGVRVEAFVVMPDHYHVVLRLEQGELGSRLAVIGRWASWAARMQGLGTGLWQDGYWDRRLRDGREYERAVGYVHENPVTAGFVAVAGQWPWSTANAAVRARLAEARP